MLVGIKSIFPKISPQLSLFFKRSIKQYYRNYSYSRFSVLSTSFARLSSSSCTNPSNPNTLSEDLVHHLERTSLVDFDNAEALARLNEAITFANQLFEVDTTEVEPLITVLENEPLPLRDDVVEPTNRKDILKNASITEEDYFVAPPGNIPLEKAAKEFIDKTANKS